MKNVVKIITVLLVVVGLGAYIFAQPKLGEKESAEMKTKRNSHFKMMLQHIKDEVAKGDMTKEEGVYRIKEVSYLNIFRNANPEWTMFEKNKNKFGRGEGRPPRGDDDRRNDGMRGPRRGGDRDSAKKTVTKENETTAMQATRHKVEQKRIKRIKKAAKKGSINTQKAAYLIKKIKYQSSFKDSNPEWRKYGRGRKERRGPRGGRGGRGGMRND